MSFQQPVENYVENFTDSKPCVNNITMQLFFVLFRFGFLSLFNICNVDIVENTTYLFYKMQMPAVVVAGKAAS